MTEGRPTDRPTALDRDLMTAMRAVLVKAVEYLVQIVHDKMKSDPTVFNFEDIELAVSTDNLTSTNCPVLETNELAHFVRLTEKSANWTMKPRTLTIGVVLTHVHYVDPPQGKVSPFKGRIWEASRASWVNTDDLLAETSDKLVPEIQRAILDALHTACMDFVTAPETLVSSTVFTNKDAIRMKTE